MSLESITLPTNKTETKISNNRRTIRSGEKGLSIKVTLVNADDQPYNLSDFSLEFNELKDGRKVVIDDATGNKSGKFNIVDATGGVFEYTLAPDVYSASGKCWFVLKKDDQIIDTTKDFYFDVLQDATIHIDNDNYVSSLQAQIDMFEATVQKAKQDIGHTVTDLTKQITDTSNDLTHTSNQAKADALAAIKTAQDNATKTLNDLTSQYDGYLAKYNALEAKINADIKTINDNATAEINSIKSDWSEQTEAINVDAKTKIDAAIAAVETARDNAIKQAVSDFSSQRDNLQADYNSWKQDTVNDFNGQLATLQGKIDAETKQQSDLKAAIDSARAAVDKIADVDFTKFAHKDDVDQALKSIDFGKIGIKENYLNPSTNVAQRTIFPVKQSDGNWIFDRASDDATAETAKEALEQVLQNGKTLNHLSEQFNTKADKDDVDEALKKSNNNEGKINDLRNGKLNFTQASDGYDLLSIDQTWGIIEFNNVKDIKNLPPLSNKTWMYALKLIKDDWGSVIVFSQDNTIYQNVLNGTLWAGWSRVLRSDDLTNLQNQITDRATKSKVNVAAPLFRHITSSNTWQDILGVANGTNGSDGNQILESIRDDAGGNTLGNFSSAVAFGGGDTKGVLNVAYADHTARIIGGNSDRPQWHEDIAWKSDITNLSNQLQAQSSTINDLKNKVSNLTPFTIITQAQYDKLTEAQKQSGTYGISG